MKKLLNVLLITVICSLGIVGASYAFNNLGVGGLGGGVSSVPTFQTVTNSGAQTTQTVTVGRLISTGTATSTFAGAVSSTRYIANPGGTTEPSFSFSSDTDTGIYQFQEGGIGFVTNGALNAIFDSTGNNVYLANLSSGNNDVNDLGSATKSWKNIYASGTAYLNNAQVLRTGSVTSTLWVGSISSKGQICVGDQDGTGGTCFTGNNGVLTAYSTSTY